MAFGATDSLGCCGLVHFGLWGARSRDRRGGWAGLRCGGSGRAALVGGLDERQGCFGDVLPAAIEDEGVASVGDLLEMGGTAVALLLSVGGGGDGMRGDVVFLACNQ